MSVKKGDLLVPTTSTAKSTWGSGIVIEPCLLNFPPAHYVYWFGHKRNILIEQEVLDENFEIVSGGLDGDLAEEETRA